MRLIILQIQSIAILLMFLAEVQVNREENPTRRLAYTKSLSEIQKLVMTNTDSIQTKWNHS